MKKLYTLIFLVSLGLTSFSQSLWIENPNWWGSEPGTIDAASVVITPGETHYRYDMFMRFSADGSYYPSSYPNTQFEIIYDFSLPEGALVIDSWLEFEGEWLVADIHNKWSATDVYDGIVNRRRDPSLFTKINDTDYKLQIYPMLGNDSRFVKLSFLLPAPLLNTGTLPLLNDLLTSSNIDLQSYSVYLDNSQSDLTFGLAGTSKSFVTVDHPSFGTVERVILDASDISGTPKLLAQVDVEQDFFCDTYTADNGENYFVFGLDPSELISSQAPSDTLFAMINFNEDHSYASLSTVLSELSDRLKSTLDPNDKFNIGYTSLGIGFAFNSYVDATDANIDAAIQEVQDNSSKFGTLAGAITGAIGFVQGQGGSDILLIDASNSYPSQSNATDLLDEFTALYSDLPTFNCLSLGDRSRSYVYWRNGTYYYGSDVFLQDLANATSGTFTGKQAFGLDVESAIELAIEANRTRVDYFDLFEVVDQGLAFDEFYLQGQEGELYLDEPLIKIGKYVGAGPITVSLAMHHDNIFVSQDFTCVDDGVQEDADSLLEEVWAGAMIASLESQGASNDNIQEIIDLSIDHRVLSRYTAFLALEPNMDFDELCDNCDDNILAVFGDEVDEAVQISVFPNPVMETATFKLSLNDLESQADMSIKITDMMGRTVRILDANDGTGVDEFEIEWDGFNDAGNFVEEGVYLVVVQSGDRKFTSKFVVRK